MSLLKQLPDSVDVIFHACIDTIDTLGTIDALGAIDAVDFKSRLIGIKAAITKHDADFAAAAKASTFYKLLPHDNVGGTVTQKEMSWVYDARMVKVQAARVYYDKIKRLVRNRRCPLCLQGTVYNLDHYMPKSEFPGLAVCPGNLVPSCRDCNTTKLAKVPTCASKQTINPYYDDLDDEMWLGAKVVCKKDIAFTYHVIRPTNWTTIKWLRVKSHFNDFHLGQLYADKAVEEYEDVKEYLANLWRSGGESAVKSHLTEQADSRTKARKNSCHAALYRALAASKWFCRTGSRG